MPCALDIRQGRYRAERKSEAAHRRTLRCAYNTYREDDAAQGWLIYQQFQRMITSTSGLWLYAMPDEESLSGTRRRYLFIFILAAASVADMPTTKIS